MADKQYDIPIQQQKLLEEKAKRRAFLRHEYLKQISNPHIHATGKGGTVFDPAIQRYIALRATGYDHFKPTPKTTRFGIFYIAIPILSFAYLLKYDRNKKEHLYRTGQVAYKDRGFKFQ